MRPPFNRILKPTCIVSVGCSLFLILTSFGFCLGQDAPPERVDVEVETKDSRVIKGKLVGIVRDSVTLLDENNVEHRIAMIEVRNIDYVKGARKTGRWFDSPNTTRYLLASTAIPLRKKEVVLQATYLFLISANYGISNRVSIGAGTDIITQSFYFLNTKVNLVNEGNYKLSTGVHYYRFPRSFFNSSNQGIRNIGMAYGASTWGNQNSHLTLGVGYIYAGGSFYPPLVTLSGTARFAKHFAFVSENWLFLGDDSQMDLPLLISLGLRYLNKRSAVDLAFYNDQNLSLGVGLLYLGYTFKFGRKSH